jgi:hypothetical protein
MSERRKIRVAVVDDHPLVRSGQPIPSKPRVKNQIVPVTGRP